MFLLALLPIIQPIKTFLPITWSMLVLVLMVPYIIVKLFKTRVKVQSTAIVAVYSLFRIFNHSTSASELLTMLFLIALVIALRSDIINFEKFYYFVIMISFFASLLIIIQTLCHYVLGLHLTILSPMLLRTHEMELSYYTQLTTGMQGVLYRPSAFFIEPSAFSFYALPALFLLVNGNDQQNKRKRYIAYTISAGVLLSTSGIGLLYVVICWAFYMYREAVSNKKNTAKYIIILITAIACFAIAVIYIPILNQTFMRIFSSSDNSYSAITGRVGSGQYYYSLLSQREKIWGAGKSVEEYKMYLSGMYSIIMSDGIIGYILFLLIFVLLAFSLKNYFSMLSLIFAFSSIFSNIATIQSTVFCLCAAYAGFYIHSEERYLKEKHSLLGR